MNVIDVLVAEFRESIRPHIPEIISLLSDSVLDVRRAGADAFDALVAEFRESIRPHIHEIISLLSDSVSDVRRVGADALSKLSEQGESINFLI